MYLRALGSPEEQGHVQVEFEVVGIDDGAEFTVRVGMYRKWTHPGFM